MIRRAGGEGSRIRRLHPWPNPLDPKELTDLRELVMSLVWSEEALVSLLEERSVLTRAEVLEKIKGLQEALEREKSSEGMCRRFSIEQTILQRDPESVV